MTRLVLCSAVILLATSACATGGSAWMARPLPGEESGPPGNVELPPASAQTTAAARPARYGVTPQVIGGSEATPDDEEEGAAEPIGLNARTRIERRKLAGHVLGQFRNTYYYFPSESDFTGGKTVALDDPSCKPIAQVPSGFFQAVCVQGSGMLASGATVSFAKRDCSCAATCDKTGEKICFDRLDQNRYPWGRGATGLPITPLITVAVDTHLIPLGTPIYIPEYDGVPRDVGHHGVDDGCFIAQDRGRRVTGKHIDIFTGDRELTEMWNHLVPSNHGVTVVLDSPHCARVQNMPPLAPPSEAHHHAKHHAVVRDAQPKK
jgi:3D (Asp-Asp-Asp) domain-containing protein